MRPMHSKHDTKSQMQGPQVRPVTDRSHPSKGAPKNAKVARPKNAKVKKPSIPGIVGPLARPSATKIYTRKRRLASTLNPPIFRFQRIKIMENGSKICLLPTNLKSRRKMRAIMPLNNQKTVILAKEGDPRAESFKDWNFKRQI